MATKTIIATVQPQVTCEVCTRTLLRGEHADVYVDAGRRLSVCELCAPRAVQEGWRREADEPEIELPPARPRAGGALFQRLRGRRRASEQGEAESEQPAPFDRLDEDLATDAPVVEELTLDEPVAPLVQAAAIFNTSEFPRRIAGVARSLGEPEVSIFSTEHHREVVRILVAWELSWYRYEVDLTEPAPAARVLEQGSELGDLPREERLANAVVSTDGQIVQASA